MLSGSTTNFSERISPPGLQTLASLNFDGSAPWGTRTAGLGGSPLKTMRPLRVPQPLAGAAVGAAAVAGLVAAAGAAPSDAGVAVGADGAAAGVPPPIPPFFEGCVTSTTPTSLSSL